MPAAKNKSLDEQFFEYESDNLATIQKYIERLDMNATRLRHAKITERVSQGAIRDMIKSNRIEANIEVKPTHDSLRRMDIYGELAPGRQYVVEVKMGFDGWINGVAQLNYYCHLLTLAGRKPTELVLAFHDEGTSRVPDEIFDYCDEETITALMAHEVANHLKSIQASIIAKQI